MQQLEVSEGSNWHAQVYRNVTTEVRKKNSVVFSPQGNYTDLAIAACRRS
jgi:hypothetical protein